MSYRSRRNLLRNIPPEALFCVVECQYWQGKWKDAGGRLAVGGSRPSATGQQGCLARHDRRSRAFSHFFHTNGRPSATASLKLGTARWLHYLLP
jgi:hypothetical protein